MTQNTEADRRVLAGATFLDTHPNTPADWRQRIDLTKFNIASSEHCVLGQIFAENHDDEYGSDGYGYAQDIAFADQAVNDDDFNTEYGFCSGRCDNAEGESFYVGDMELTLAWKRYLQSDQGKGFLNLSAELSFRYDKALADITHQQDVVRLAQVKLDQLNTLKHDLYIALSAFPQ